MPEYKKFATDLWNKFGKFGKALTIIAGVVAAYTTIEPTITATADKVHRIWTTQERIDLLQSDIDTLKNSNIIKKEKLIRKEFNALKDKVKHLEEINEDKQDYIIVLDGIIDGVLGTYYHRGIRYGATIEDDLYYHTDDCDHIKKWMRAIYTAEKDIYGYIDHDGDYHVITPQEPSELFP
jgi:FtsZ-binding cell division protein ZapB